MPPDADPRVNDIPGVTYIKEDDKWVFRDPQTEDEYEYNTALDKWLPLAQLQQQLKELKQRKIQELKDEKLAKRKQRVNTAVYVSNLPSDIDLVELKQLFSRYGVIAQDLWTNKLKVKLYTDDEGKFKGDALIVYLRPESVALSIQMMDEYDIRSHRIKVQEAEWTKLATGDEPLEQPQPQKRHLSDKERDAIKKKARALASKIEDWNGDDEAINPKWSRTMVLQRAFTLDELKEDPEVKQDIVEDVKEGCERFGIVEKVILFDLEVEGVVLVRFRDVESTKKCIEVCLYIQMAHMTHY